MQHLIPHRTWLRAVIRDNSSRDLTMRQMAVLLHVATAANPQDWTMGGLAEDLGVTPPVITRAIDALIEQGLVEKKPNPDDMRKHLVNMTPKGRDYAASLNALAFTLTAPVP